MFLHDIWIGRIDTERYSRESVGDEIYPQQVDCQQRQRYTYETGDEQDRYLSHIAGQEIIYKLFDIIIDSPSLLHCVDYRVEIII